MWRAVMRVAVVALCFLGLAGVMLAPETAFATASPTDWAAKFCPAYRKWATTSAALQTNFATSIRADAAGTRSPAAMKAALRTLLGGQAKNTAAFVSALKAAGSPSSMNGAKISAELVRAFRGERDQSLAFIAKAKKLDTTNTSRFKAELAAILKSGAGSIGSQAAQGLSNLKQLDAGGVLNSALSTNQTCVPTGSS
jgi:hypothetical protein